MEDINIAKDYLLSNKMSMVIVKNGSIIVESKDRGIKPIFDVYTKSKEHLIGATVADKVIGKAAAMILLNGGIKSLYAELISESAINIFKTSGINVEYTKKVPLILNREGNDMCPIEKLSSNTVDVNKLISDIDKFINKAK